MNIVITGSIAYDYLMSFPGRFQDAFVADKLDRISLSFLVDSLKRLGNIAPKNAGEMSKMQKRLVAAGYRRNEALLIFAGIRVGVALLTFVLLSTPLIVRPNLGTALVGAIIAYLVPGFVLGKMASKRQHVIRMGLPDALGRLCDEGVVLVETPRTLAGAPR